MADLGNDFIEFWQWITPMTCEQMGPDNGLLQEISQGFPEVENSLFWKIWPFYVKFVCPVAILMVYVELLGFI